MELTKEQLIEIGQKVEDLSELLLPLEDIGTEIVQFIEQITGQKIVNKSIDKQALPPFLYEMCGDIRIGYHGDTVVTDEWNDYIGKFKNSNKIENANPEY